MLTESKTKSFILGTILSLFKGEIKREFPGLMQKAFKGESIFNQLNPSNKFKSN